MSCLSSSQYRPGNDQHTSLTKRLTDPCPLGIQDLQCLEPVRWQRSLTRQVPVELVSHAHRPANLSPHGAIRRRAPVCQDQDLQVSALPHARVPYRLYESRVLCCSPHCPRRNSIGVCEENRVHLWLVKLARCGKDGSKQNHRFGAQVVAGVQKGFKQRNVNVELLVESGVSSLQN